MKKLFSLLGISFLFAGTFSFAVDKPDPVAKVRGLGGGEIRSAYAFDRTFSTIYNPYYNSEKILKLSYNMTCDPSVPGIPSLFGTVGISTDEGKEPDVKIRFELLAGKNLTEVLLVNMRTIFPKVQVMVRTSDKCKLVDELGVEFEDIETFMTPRGGVVIPDGSSYVDERNVSNITDKSIQKLALKHSPFINIRPDQGENYVTDVPLKLVYDVRKRKKENHLEVRYTAYFSDEDSKTTPSDLAGQMTRYGRRMDIEWVYKVTLDGKKGYERIKGEYQRFLHGATKIESNLYGNCFGYLIKNDYICNHPLLFNSDILGEFIDESTVTKNNVFSIRPANAITSKNIYLEGYSLVPRMRMMRPMAREWAVLEDPALLMRSDAELALEKKLQRPFMQYLYLLVDGKLNAGKFKVELDLRAEKDFKSGWSSFEFGEFPDNRQRARWGVPPLITGNGNVDRLGEDMYNQQAFTGIPLSLAIVDEIVLGRVLAQIQIRKEGTIFSRDLNLEANALRVFRFVPDESDVGYRFQEITDRFEAKRVTNGWNLKNRLGTPSKKTN